MIEKHSFFDGAVTKELVHNSGGWWRDTWKGPGGVMVATRLRLTQFDAKVEFTPTEGEPVVDHIYEGGDYPMLPDLFGPDLWSEYQGMSGV